MITKSVEQPGTIKRIEVRKKIWMYEYLFIEEYGIHQWIRITIDPGPEWFLINVYKLGVTPSKCMYNARTGEIRDFWYDRGWSSFGYYGMSEANKQKLRGMIDRGELVFHVSTIDRVASLLDDIKYRIVDTFGQNEADVLNARNARELLTRACPEAHALIADMIGVKESEVRNAVEECKN